MNYEGAQLSSSLVPEQKEEEYLKMLAELELVLKKNEEEQKQYIEKRVALLSENNDIRELSLVGKKVHKGFISPKTDIRRNILVDPFVMDDLSLYEDFFTTLKQFKSTPGWKEKQTREIIPTVVQWCLTRYFGNAAGRSDTEAKNREFYMDHYSDSDFISIKELKGKGIAVCAEKAASAQNLLAFVGLESDLILSGNCRIPDEGQEEAHYYNIIHGPKGEMIYDPTNPKISLDKDGRLDSFSPAMYSLTKEQAKNLMSGGSVTVEHLDREADSEGNIKEKKSLRIYSGPKQL